MRYSYFILLSLAIIVLASCRQIAEHNTAKKVLRQADAIIDQQPDTALSYLKSIAYPENLTKSERMDYYLLLIQAKDKCKRDISADTVIVEAKDYFIKKRNWDKAATAAFYYGRTLHSKRHFQRTMQAYLDAEHLAEQCDDNTLKGRIQHNIGGLYYNQDEYNKAITFFKNASHYFQSTDNYVYHITSLRMIGNSFLSIHEIDSALYYYEKGIELAKLQNDDALQASIIQNISILYRRIGNLDSARIYLRKSLDLSSKEEDKKRLYLNYANFYKTCNQPDSAIFYAQRALQCLKNDGTANTTVASIYFLMYSLEKDQQHYRQALDYLLQYSEQLDAIYQESKEQSITGIREKYDFEVLKNANQRLEIEKQRMLLWILFSLLIIISIIFYFYWWSARQKKRFMETQRQAYDLKEQLENLSGQEHVVRGWLLQRFEVLKKLAIIGIQLREDEQGLALIRKVNAIVCGVEGGNIWDAFYKTANDLHNGKLEAIRQNCPALEKDEFKVCCLSALNFSNKEIALVLSLSLRTVELKRSLAREKLNLGKRESFKELLAEK